MRCFVAGKPIAAKDFILVGKEPLDPAIANCLVGHYVPALLVPTETVVEGRLRRTSSRRQVYARDLDVNVEGRTLRFKALLGTDALLMEPILGWTFDKWTKETETALFC